jgi:TetR/AcrR family transcriptional repressor of nem operon
LAGQRDGSIATERPAADLARLLLTTVLGLRVLARTRPDPEILESALQQALTLLER